MRYFSREIAYIIRIPTVLLDKRMIKLRDLAGSGRRLDVACRCILASLRGRNGIIRKNINVYLVIGKGEVLSLNVENNDLKIVPDSELEIARLLLKEPKLIKILPYKGLCSFIDTLINQEYRVIVLHEKGKTWRKMLKNGILQERRIAFVIGGPYGIPKEEENELRAMKLDMLSLGRKRYLASECIAILNFLLGGMKIVRQIEGSL